ncbi:hypothetical protein GQ44DRAFT_777782 [Phaeosphaeriaceae sp. PMI808]|nr:hypothetical protein GQ44DRAFT_777782 [Phaeosphaeriaceae sp. PMI808]
MNHLTPESPQTLPVPPPSRFRIIKRLSSASNTTHAVYLCLPRALELFSPATDIDTTFRERVAKEHTSFSTLPHAYMHCQMWLLSYPRYGDTLVRMIEQLKSSSLPRALVQSIFPSLTVVKMGACAASLRREIETIEALTEHDEDASMHIGSYVVGTQTTGSCADSYLVMAPVFGRTLREFAEVSGGLPSWMIAHVVLGLVDAVKCVHDKGITHGKLDMGNVMLNMYPRRMFHRYRGYPDVVLVDFAGAKKMDRDGDVRALLGIVERLVWGWSDLTPLAEHAVVGDTLWTDDPLLILLQHARDMVALETQLMLQDTGMLNFVLCLEKIRHGGPMEVPGGMVMLLHSDLATEEEFEDAMRDPTVLQFVAKKDEFKSLAEGGLVEDKACRNLLGPN